jgi:ABC-type lipoprotein release transport system permease subunit
MVVRQGMGIAWSGMVVGALVTGFAAHAVSSLLFGVSPLDPVSFGAAIVFLFAVALPSTGLPAWRATHTDPVSAMRR